MKTIKIIDLLNKIANGEKVPKKIKINNIVYEYRDYMYCTEKANYQDIENYLFGKWNFNILNDEVEILEDEKKIPEKFNIEDDGNIITLFGEKENEWAILDNADMFICNKINEILDYLKSKGE